MSSEGSQPGGQGGVRDAVFRFLVCPKFASPRVDSDGGESMAQIDDVDMDRQWEQVWADHHP